MRVVITGSTGMVGKGVLLECLDHASVSEVLVINRRSLAMEHPKLKEQLHPDFSDFSGIDLSGYDACFCCMGVSVAGKTKAEYHKLTYDYTLALAHAFYKANPKATITYVSGEGTDSSEKGRIMWARVKGATENALLQMGFRQAFMFRPGIIIPKRGIRSSTRLYQFFYDYFLWMIYLIRRFAPQSVVDTTDMGYAMIEASLSGYDSAVVRPKDILALSRLLQQRP